MQHAKCSAKTSKSHQIWKNKILTQVAFLEMISGTRKTITNDMHIFFCKSSKIVAKEVFWALALESKKTNPKSSYAKSRSQKRQKQVYR